MAWALELVLPQGKIQWGKNLSLAAEQEESNIQAACVQSAAWFVLNMFAN